MEIENKTDKSTRVTFKPLTEGLGINHFADGLPYAPANQNKKIPPKFFYDEPVMPKPKIQVQAPIVSPEPKAAPQESNEEEEIHYASFMRRTLAFGLDLFFISAIFLFVLWASFSLNGLGFKAVLFDQKGLQIFWLLLLLYSVVHLGYFLIQEISWKTTLGKALFGIQIRSKSGFATVGRAICFFIAAIPFGVGLFWYFFDSKKRCWHDVITDCEVVLV